MTQPRSTPDIPAKEAISFVEIWVKRFSVLLINYRKWHISIHEEEKISLDMDYSVSYDTGSNENAITTREYFRQKGMNVDAADPRAGSYIYIFKKQEQYDPPPGTS